MGLSSPPRQGGNNWRLSFSYHCVFATRLLAATVPPEAVGCRCLASRLRLRPVRENHTALLRPAGYHISTKPGQEVLGGSGFVSVSGKLERPMEDAVVSQPRHTDPTGTNKASGRMPGCFLTPPAGCRGLLWACSNGWNRILGSEEDFCRFSSETGQSENSHSSSNFKLSLSL